MNYSRKELLQTDTTMNQMRNAIYELTRFMKKNGVLEVEHKLRKIGKNIAKTYIQYWKPTDFIDSSNIKDVITTIYQKILNSTVLVEINNEKSILKVQDYKCALCKYPYDDIEKAGCEIILGMVSEIVSSINKESKNPSPLLLEPYRVEESRAFGDKACIQLYKYKNDPGD